MKILITISEKYIKLVDAHIYLFKKYWPDHPEIIFLGYKNISKKIEDKFYFFNMSDTDIPADKWSVTLLDYLNNFYVDKEVLIFLDDIFLVKKIINDKIKKCKQLVEQRVADKIYLIGTFTKTPGCSYSNQNEINGFDGIVKVSENSMWRNSLQPCIWNVECLKAELRKFETSVDPWTFEECNLDKSNNIYSFSRDYPMMISHVYRRGSLLPDWYLAMSEYSDGSRLDSEDLDILKHLV